MVRAVRLSEMAIASSVHPAPDKASMARQRSTGPMSARTTFSATATMRPVLVSSSSSSCTRTWISFSPALIAAFTRRRPATMVEHVRAGGLAHERRLAESDRLDRGEQLRIRIFARRGLAGVVRILPQLAGIDCPEFHGSDSLRYCLPYFWKTPPRPQPGAGDTIAGERPCPAAARDPRLRVA